ncbi:DUF2470 domain-containing protein [Gordonia shandongensis]|uniref:DUF2470 domain-containing protein n=1 Tax=Gordonia shandongensis TaxID=376351 RepID=UPI0003FB8648|nr:DUF2470 domain-containing protein [Gordonia shandongensis]
MTTFDDTVIAAVTGHMNDDHTDDNLTIVRAFGVPDATAATMVGLDSTSGTWSVTVDGAERTVEIPWFEELTDRASIRRQVVELYQEAARRLGSADA